MQSDSNWKRKTILFLISQCITLFGSSLVQFALVWFVTRETSSGVWVSAFTVCSCLPQFLISFIAGAWADRYSRKMLIIISDSVIAVATLILALFIPAISNNTVLLIALLVTSVVRSLGAGVQLPAVNAMLPQLVPSEQLMRFNGINSTIQSFVQFVAPAAAGAILTFSKLQSTLFVDVVTAAVGVGILSCIFIPKQANDMQQEQASMLTDFKSGFKYAFSDKFLGRLLLLYGIFIFLCVPAGFLATLFVSLTYGDSYTYMTIVEVVGFAGMMLGGILIGVWGGFSNKVKTLFVGMLAFGMLAIGMGAVDSFIAYLAFMLVYGIALTMVQTATTTLIQDKSEPNMQGRVFGFLGAMYSGFLPIGMVVFGPLADVMPIRWVMIASGVALMLMAVMVFLKKSFYNAGKAAITTEKEN